MTDAGMTDDFSVRRLFVQYGPLRLALALFAVVTMVFAPAPGTPASFEGWAFVSTMLAPVLAPLFFAGLMLDAMMARIMMSSAEGGERRRLRNVLFVDLALGAALFLYWLPYYLAIAR